MIGGGDCPHCKGDVVSDVHRQPDEGGGGGSESGRLSVLLRRLRRR